MLVSVDIEADGPVPGMYSMIAFAAVVVEPGLTRTFKRYIRPVTDDWVADALAVSGFTRKETESFGDPYDAMQDFAIWLRDIERPMFIADNNGFDFAFINYYFHKFYGANPFGWSSRNLSDLYKGMRKSLYKNHRHLRKTPHDHDPLNDAMGNAEALLAMHDMGLKFKIG